MSTHASKIVAHAALVKPYKVYVHKLRSNGRVFFVGMGKGDAPWKVTKKTDAWREVVAKRKYDVVVVKEFFKEKEAKSFKEKLLGRYEPSDLVNARKAIKGRPPVDRVTYRDAYVSFVHHSGETFEGTVFSFSKTYHIDFGAVVGLVKGYTDRLCGWTRTQGGQE